jgi:hypothetical protein
MSIVEEAMSNPRNTASRYWFRCLDTLRDTPSVKKPMSDETKRKMAGFAALGVGSVAVWLGLFFWCWWSVPAMLVGVVIDAIGLTLLMSDPPPPEPKPKKRVEPVLENNFEFDAIEDWDQRFADSQKREQSK